MASEPGHSGAAEAHERRAAGAVAAGSGEHVPAPSIAELSACLVALGDNDLLDMPFARLCDGLKNPDTRELFEHLASDHRGYNLRSVLRFGELDPWVARTCTERETRLIRAQLQRWLEAADEPKPPVRDWQGPVQPEALALLNQRLLELLPHCAGAGEPLPRFSRERPLRVDVAQACVKAELCSDARQTSQSRFGVFACELSLQGYEHGPLSPRCNCEPAGTPSYRCCHVRALCVRMLDILHGPDSALRRELSRIGQTPSWVRFFSALGPPLLDAQSTSEPTRRLVWKLRLDRNDHVRIAPALQKRVRDNFSNGARITLEQVPQELCDATDTLVLGLMRSGAAVVDGEYVCNLALLRVLIDHPRLLDAHTHALLALEETRVELDLQPVSAGLVAHARLAGRPLDMSEPPRADHVARSAADAAQGRWLFAPLPAALGRFVSGLTTAKTVLPPESHAQLRQRLRELQPYAALALPPQLTGSSEEAARKLVLRLSNGAGEGVLRAELLARPLVGGPVFLPGLGPSEVLGEREGRHAYALRDLAHEKNVAAELLQALNLDLAHAEAPYRFRVDELPASLALLERVARARDQVDIEWLTGHRPLRLFAEVRRRDLKLKVGRAQRWFEASGHAEVASGQHVPLTAMLDAARTGQRYVRIAADSYVTLHEELRILLERASDVIWSERDKLKLAANVLPAFFELAEPACIERAPELDALLERMQKAPTQEIALPEHVRVLLRPYQRAGAEFLLRLSTWASGACLADEMGLGKTLQALCALSARKDAGPALVVAPTSVGHAWCSEAARFTPELRMTLYRGPERARLREDLGPGQVLVTSYELVQRDRAALAQIPFATLVLDEAHMVKNATTERARAVASLSAEFRIGLTGTPLENHLGELWSLMAQLNPGVLGSFNQFRSRFGVPIERFGKEERMVALRKLVSPFMLRREKREVAPELPARIEVTQLVGMGAAEQSLYDAAVLDLRTRIAKRRSEGKDVERVELLAEITRLRQLACHPRLVLADWPHSGSKLRYLEETLAELLPRGHRALLFSQFVGHLQLVRNALAARGHDSLYLDGSTPERERARLVQRWQTGEGALFLISLKAGGTGLHLPGADYVFHLDPWWNPAVEDQASDRAHRIGQHRPVTIVRLLAQGTVEEQVAALHDEKRELALSLLQETGARTWDTHELAAYLGLS